MQLTINGEACTCAEGLTVAALLREREHDATAVVVEHNGQIVPAADFAATALNEGDVLEIVQFVGGGEPPARRRFFFLCAQCAPRGPVGRRRPS